MPFLVNQWPKTAGSSSPRWCRFTSEEFCNQSYLLMGRNPASTLFHWSCSQPCPVAQGHWPWSGHLLSANWIVDVWTFRSAKITECRSDFIRYYKGKFYLSLHFARFLHFSSCFDWFWMLCMMLDRCLKLMQIRYSALICCLSCSDSLPSWERLGCWLHKTLSLSPTDHCLCRNDYWISHLRFSGDYLMPKHTCYHW